MRCLALTLSAVALELSLVHAQAPVPRARSNAAPAAVDLAIRRVVLYKSGVGYFEHLGRVHDSQPVNIDFTSAQLDDVLKSLTALDLGNGRISGISYNSEKPVSERLSALPFAGQEPNTRSSLLNSLSGARLEVRSGGRQISGRLLGVDFAARGVEAEAKRHDEISIVSDAGSIDTIALTPSTRVRLVERDTAITVGAYLNVLTSTRAPDRRRLMIAASGTGERDLLVSYISEVPIWKTTYRVVLSPDHPPLLQGWAIVDNTTGTDWNNVELALVAGAPQSFIQHISQPQYGRRNIVAPTPGTQPRPQTHDPTLSTGPPVLAGSSGGGVGGGTYRSTAPAQVAGGITGGIVGGLAAVPAPPPPMAARLQEQLIAATGNDIADMFEYRVGTPMTIRSGQSSLVPIVNAPIDIERVTWWNGAPGARPLRAMWMTNVTGLTLDGGSFTVLDGATFAGEGLVDPLKPRERRLLSYAFDLGVQIEVRQPESPALVRRVVAQRGVVVEHKEQRTRRVYTVRNNDTTPRRVVVEHPRRNGWELAAGRAQPIETTSNAYRFAIEVAPAQTVTLAVDETADGQSRYQLSSLNEDQIRLLIDDSGNDPELRSALAVIRAKQSEAAIISKRIAEVGVTIEQATQAQDRLRQNLIALKDTPEGRKMTRQYAADLVATEARIRDGQRQRGELQRGLDIANGDVRQLMDQLAVDISVRQD